ncbi:hypothetical protein C8Q77DRAFT_1160962 [Trametes polyzona]|nr:hypothetical protein C8Q77DRAFT_1160962 [Trametes polyzona]
MSETGLSPPHNSQLPEVQEILESQPFAIGFLSNEALYQAACLSLDRSWVPEHKQTGELSASLLDVATLTARMACDFKEDNGNVSEEGLRRAYKDLQRYLHCVENKFAEALTVFDREPSPIDNVASPTPASASASPRKYPATCAASSGDSTPSAVHPEPRGYDPVVASLHHLLRDDLFEPLTEALQQPLVDALFAPLTEALLTPLSSAVKTRLVDELVDSLASTLESRVCDALLAPLTAALLPSLASGIQTSAPHPSTCANTDESKPHRNSLAHTRTTPEVEAAFDARARWPDGYETSLSGFKHPRMSDETSNAQASRHRR